LSKSRHQFILQSNTLLLASPLNLLVALGEFRSGQFLTSLSGHLALFHFN